MSQPHAKFATLADRLIAKHGRPVKIIRRDRTPTASGKPWEGVDHGAGVPTEVSARAVFETKEVSARENLPKSGSQVAWVAAEQAGAHKLHLFDRIEDGDDVWQIVRGEPIQPGETGIAYRLDVEALR